MRILIGGASGLIGTLLRDELQTRGHTVQRLVRGEAQNGDVSWDPQQNRLDPDALNGFDTVIHLSGENVAGKRWTPSQKKKIIDSRIKSTRLLSDAIVSIANPPQTWLCASAVGWYGDRGDEWVDEASAPGDGFLAGVCRSWEEATSPAAKAGTRVANLRFAVVLSPDGGAFKQMMSIFRMGVGGVIGDGTQYMSWITREDTVRAILHVMDNPFIQGPVNIASPNPVTNRELTKALGRALHRPTVLPFPAFAARLVFGEMADEMFLASTRVKPARLFETGFVFDAPELYIALQRMLG